jgi:quercetin dioxygenase-like cupin family protein
MESIMNQPKKIDTTSIEPRQMIKGAKVWFVHSEKMTMAQWEFEPGVELPEHSHPHEQISNIISGTFILVIEGTDYPMPAGSILIIPPHAKHSGRAVSKCRIVDVFHPVRQDYR